MGGWGSTVNHNTDITIMYALKEFINMSALWGWWIIGGKLE